MIVTSYFSSPSDLCERLISGLEFCINIDEIEIDEDIDILYSMLEKGLFYHGMFQNFNNLTFIKQIEVLLENFTEFESALWIPKVEIPLIRLYSEIVPACADLIFRFCRIFSRERSYSIIFSNTIDLFLFHVINSTPKSALRLSADLEFSNLNESCTVISFLESFLTPTRIETDVVSFNVLSVFTVTPSAKDCASYEKSLRGIRKSEQIISIESIRKCIVELDTSKMELLTIPEKNIFVESPDVPPDFMRKQNNENVLRESLMCELMKSTESEDIASFGMRAYQALRENVFSQKSWDDQCFIEEEDGAEDEADQGENADEVLKEEDAETDPSEDGQSKTDEYIFYEENGNSQFKRLSQSVDEVIFGLDDSHHSDDEAQWSPLASRAQENEKVSERQWSPLASRAQENEKVSERQWSPLVSRGRLQNSQESETAVKQSSSVDSSHHSSHNEPFEDDSGGMIHLVPSTDSNCTETDEDEPPPHVYHDMSPIQEETRGLIENLTNTTLSLTINGHRPMPAPREVFDTAPPPKEVIYVDIQTVFNKLSCVSNNINATRAALLEKKTQKRIELGKEIFLRIQAAAAAKRTQAIQPTRPQAPERVPPLPKWIDPPKQISLPGSLKKEVPHPDRPERKSPKRKPPSPQRPEITPTATPDDHSIPIKNENLKVRSSPLQSGVHPVTEDPAKQREQIIRERGRQYALNQWRQQNSVKESTSAPPSTSIPVKHESDNSTVVTEVSEQSSFSTGAKSVASVRPKAAKLIIAATDDQDSKAEEENQRRLQMFEMVKKKKASEAAEREKNRQLMKARELQELDQQKIQSSSAKTPAMSHMQSPGYLRHHLEKVSDDEQILKLESEVASLNPASVKSSKSANSVSRRNSSADPSHRRPQPVGDQEKSHPRSQSAGRVSRASSNGGRANVQQIRNALTSICLAGPHQAPVREETLLAIDNYLQVEGSSTTQFIIVMHQSKMLSFKGLYIVDGPSTDIRRLSGRGPRVLPVSVIEEYYKYESSTRSFRKLPTLSLNSTCDAVTVNPTKIKKLGKDRPA